ncbi:acyl-CoA reductase-like NAD-dependent aldehyde dehydrogenase [Melghirimyces profundicolus]|uniref:3-sulfolactaldehyde dehydrogenase n=1 Tax=Melghirimyces profundicolus TaxID=1242148 RepID=A0A2T6C8H6_9BACL|nr:aldehyde dehydrogenase family protein [Melghirimyces profundicolus]PTX64612.1 acyl-CoA reductase-like NAD-dependent aldehyde dehydrogenase [Melghirimyces profundicolus]
MTVQQVQRYPLYIRGEWVETREWIPVKNKYTGDVIAEVGRAERHQVEEAVTRAEETFRKSSLTPFQRSEILLAASRLAEERRETLELSLVREVGKTRKDARGEMDRVINTLRLSAEEAKRISGEMVPLHATPGSENRTGWAIRVPRGVIGAITPFNYPWLLNVHKVAPAIASGNTVVLKPSSETPLAAFQLVTLLEEAGLPPGHVQVITGSGREAGEWLLRDKRIALYTFTGSAEVGQRIKEASGLRPVTLELGNNSPNLVHEDADLDLAARQIAARSFHNAGQACIAVQRILVHEKRLEAFMDRFLRRVDGLKVGDPEDPETDVGPMISEREAERAEAWVEEAIAGGAEALRRGKRQGALLPPVVLVQTTPEMKVNNREVFAPVVTVTPYRTLEEAFELANDSDYGLQAGIFTSSLNVAMRASRELEYGGVIINDVSTYRNDVMPYGGTKNSGLGKEGPRYTIEEMTELRMVVFNL